MAKLLIAGNVFVVQSSIPLEKLQLLKKYRPEALKRRNEEGTVTFAIGTGSASLNSVGVSFNDATHDERKLACLTLPIPNGTEDAKQYVADYAGAAFLELEQMERELAGVLKAIDSDMEKIRSSITYVDSAGTQLGAGERAYETPEDGTGDDE